MTTVFFFLSVTLNHKSLPIKHQILEVIRLRYVESCAVSWHYAQPRGQNRTWKTAIFVTQTTFIYTGAMLYLQWQQFIADSNFRVSPGQNNKQEPPNYSPHTKTYAENKHTV